MRAIPSKLRGKLEVIRTIRVIIDTPRLGMKKGFCKMHLKDYINMEHISKVLDKISRQVITPIETGIKYFDSTIGGYYPGEVTTICAWKPAKE